MKQVRKSDLECLIAKYYQRFIEDLLSVTEIVDGKKGIRIIVNSIYIEIIDSIFFDSQYDKELRMKEFAKQIEEVTFGNLKVAYLKCELRGAGNCHSTMDIACAYELSED